MNQLPTIALSIRQPWAWLIVNGFKDIENRDTKIGSHIGDVLIHASASMTREDYDACWLFLEGTFDTQTLAAIADHMPAAGDLQRGGIVGSALIHGISVLSHINGEKLFGPWWTGPVAYHLKDARVLPFQPCKGRLGFFKVKL